VCGKEILDADALLAQAQAQTGLGDWGDDTLPERFRLAVDFLKSCHMDESGQRGGADTCLWLLTSRLAFFEDFKRYPIANEKIVQPLFVVGSDMRSGTTLLQALLSVDPNARALRYWEVMYPSPPPGLAAPDDPRRAKADADWREINAKMHGFLRSRPYWDMLGNGVAEDQAAWAFDFRMMIPSTWWRVPFGMNIAGLPQDARAEYRIHKMMLQQLQYARPQIYWVLKGFHGERLTKLFETYPDARVIWIHRDPVQSIASRIAIMGEAVRALTGQVDWKQQAHTHLAIGRANFKATLESAMLDDPRVHNVRYSDFVRGPVEVLRGFYETYGVPFGPDTETAMRDYLKSNKRDRYGKFEYSTDIIGVDIDALHEEFAPYRRRFGLEIEQRKSERLS
jgi:hypothetical protein